MRTRVWCVLLMAGVARAQDATTIAIPALTVPFTVEGQSVSATTGGSITAIPGSVDRFRLELAVDLSDFQRNLAAILRPQLDRQDSCGDRIDLQDAAIAPHDLSGDTTVKLHYERWVCIKALGKKVQKRLVAGNGVVIVKVTPLVGPGQSGSGEAAPNTVRLSAELGSIDADGSLGELLHSGSLGQMLREKVTTSVQSSLDKAANWSATIPPALQTFLTLRNVSFQDAGSGRLRLAVSGDVRVPAGQMDALVQQLKQRR